MRTYKEREETMCPFYKSENAIEICCEGIIGDHTRSSFPNKAEKEYHKYDFCNGNYHGCPLCIELEAKYT